MKTVRIKFVDFWANFDVKNNEILSILKKYYQVEFSDTPDYLFYSCFGDEYLRYSCIRIYFTGECLVPDFNECDYAIGFDRLTFGDRYARIPLFSIFNSRNKYLQLKNRQPITLKDIEDRDFCSFVVSNGAAKEDRVGFFEQLGQYKFVASGGKYRNNVGGAVKDKNTFLQKYKFNIAFENCSHDGYCTEKILDAFVARVVPIYYGDPRIAEDFNSKAFVNAHEFPSMDAVVEHVKMLDNNPELYLQMLNEPVVQPNAGVADLEDFLLHIFEQPLHQAWRRSRSQRSLAIESAKLGGSEPESKQTVSVRSEIKKIIRFIKHNILRS